MRSHFKRTLALLSSLAMCGSMLLYYPSGTFEALRMNLPVQAAETVAISAENFPDETFRNYVNVNFDTTNSDVLSAEELLAVTEMDVNNMGIADLTGVEVVQFDGADVRRGNS